MTGATDHSRRDGIALAIGAVLVVGFAGHMLHLHLPHPSAAYGSTAMDHPAVFEAGMSALAAAAMLVDCGQPELWAPRPDACVAVAPALVGVLVGAAMVQVAAVLASALRVPRPPPHRRRQALLGVQRT